MASRLILIRHGITQWNIDKRYCGCKDIGLSIKGKAQALKVQKAVKSLGIDRIYASDRKRALQTAKIIFGGARITRVKALREINFGVLEGFSHQEIMGKFADGYTKWLKDPFRNRIPRAEPMGVFKKRVLCALRKIAISNHGKTVAIACHGGTIAILVSSILKSRDFWRYVPSAASITVLEYKKGNPRIKKFNDTSHLK